MTLFLAFVVAICTVICAVFFTRILLLGPKMALVVGGIATGAFMYWGVLGVVAGFDTSLDEGVRVTGIYWLWSSIVWIPVYLLAVWFLLPRGPARSGGRDD